MARRLRSRVASRAKHGAEIQVIEAPAEELPVESDSFDCVVSTLVLCTVEAPDRVAAEIRRVLRPGGRLLCLEHVRSPDSERLARWQDRLERPWGWVAAGCHPNRDSRATLRAAGFDVGALGRDTLPKTPPIVRPLVRGEVRCLPVD
jgi:SAM-dependent methyltransferase